MWKIWFGKILPFGISWHIVTKSQLLLQKSTAHLHEFHNRACGRDGGWGGDAGARGSHQQPLQEDLSALRSRGAGASQTFRFCSCTWRPLPRNDTWHLSERVRLHFRCDSEGGRQVNETCTHTNAHSRCLWLKVADREDSRVIMGLFSSLFIWRLKCSLGAPSPL